MRFPIEFAKNKGDYDVVSPIINFTGNAAVVALGGISLGAISYLALKALGFSKIATTMATVIPVSMGVIGGAGTILGGIMLIALVKSVVDALGRR